MHQQTTILTLVILSVVQAYSAPQGTQTIERIITAARINQHVTSGTKRASGPTVSQKENITTLDFGLSFLFIRIASGGTLLSASRLSQDRAQRSDRAKEIPDRRIEGVSKEEIEKVKEVAALFSIFMGGDDETRYPAIGKRALHTSVWDGDSTTFTTSDEKFDVEIAQIFTGDGLIAGVKLAQEVSAAYDAATTKP